MRRRDFLRGAALSPLSAATLYAMPLTALPVRASTAEFPVSKSKDEWKELLDDDMAFRVLFKEATERAGTSPLNREKRDGVFICRACNQPLFASKTKYESGTGWPSFFEALPGAVETKTDFKLIYPRKEYHCSRCGGHQGHVFNDGPEPTGLRYCNNGVALKFVPEGDELPELVQ